LVSNYAPFLMLQQILWSSSSVHDSSIEICHSYQNVSHRVGWTVVRRGSCPSGQTIYHMKTDS
jgi:hypothetical protein